MDTALLVVVMSFVALVLAAVAGGGLGLGVMRLLQVLRRPPTRMLDPKPRESIH